VICGDAVGYYGYPRATGEMDVWIAINPENAEKLVTVLKDFGFDVPNLSTKLFLEKGKITRMGVPPMRLEILNTISGVSFEECYADRTIDVIDGVKINFISILI